MEKQETLEDFYKRKFNWMPENFRNDIGHFNLFKLEPIDPEKANPLPYKRRDFFKIIVAIGDIEFHYADKAIPVKKQALVFSNPQIPYNCYRLENVKGGFYCIFNDQFFQQFGNLSQYSVFQPEGNHVFELTDEQVEEISHIYKKMAAELNSEYIHKYDVLRNLVFELLHYAMKMQPTTTTINHHPINASKRICTLFLELLERQFPIDESHTNVHLRTASDFANQLNIHVNYLNRAIKGIMEKTTTQLIAERILKESKIMLKQSSWNVGEIAYSLGFQEVTHFNNFFKKHEKISPLQYRKV